MERILAPLPENEEGWRAKNPPPSGDGRSSSTLSPPVELKPGRVVQDQPERELEENGHSGKKGKVGRSSSQLACSFRRKTLSHQTHGTLGNLFRVGHP